MARSQQQRQKKLERRAAKRKQRHKELRREKSHGLAERLARAASYPVAQCGTTQALWDNGISNVFVSRKISDAKVAFAMFLVDMYCLGVKDAFGNIVAPGEFRQMLRKIAEHTDIVPLQPADVRKLVEEAVDYARSIGLEPHSDYHKVKGIFGDIDPQESTRHFQYGDEQGKPHFIAGPNDHPARCQQIVATLERACGPNGYHFTMPFPSSPLGDLDKTLPDADDEEDTEGL